MLTVAVRFELGDRKSLSAMTDGAAVFFDWMLVEELELGMGRPGLLHVFQAAPEHPLMAGRTAVHAVEILDPDLLDPARDRRWIDLSQGLRHDGAELTLVILPIGRSRLGEDHSDGADRDHGQTQQNDQLALGDLTNATHVDLAQNGMGCSGHGCQGQ